jgi:tRNA dimethylallyltransferase
MLYFHALSQGIAELPEGNPEVRAQIDAHAAAVGWPEVHRELAEVDPEAAAKIHGNDPQRIQRALEVFRITGQPISRLQRSRVSVLEGVEVVELAVAPLDRKVLHERIQMRFAAMLSAGLVEGGARNCVKEAIYTRNNRPCARSDIGKCGDIWRVSVL